MRFRRASFVNSQANLLPSVYMVTYCIQPEPDIDCKWCESCWSSGSMLQLSLTPGYITKCSDAPTVRA